MVKLSFFSIFAPIRPYIVMPNIIAFAYFL